MILKQWFLEHNRIKVSSKLKWNLSDPQLYWALCSLFAVKQMWKVHEQMQTWDFQVCPAPLDYSAQQLKGMNERVQMNQMVPVGETYKAGRTPIPFWKADEGTEEVYIPIFPPRWNFPDAEVLGLVVMAIGFRVTAGVSVTQYIEELVQLWSFYTHNLTLSRNMLSTQQDKVAFKCDEWGET